MPDVKILDQRDRHLSPDLHHPRQKIGLFHVEAPVKTNREGNGAVGVINLQRNQMGLFRRRQPFVLADLLQIDAEQLQ